MRPIFALLVVVWTAFLIIMVRADDAGASPGWQRGIASYYTLYGNRTSCGKTAGPRTWFVASLRSDTARCGMPVTICNRPRRRCVKVTVQDRGSFNLGRAWDLQPRVKSALMCSDLCSVHWHRGW